MKSITVTLGGAAYPVNELPARKNSEWRGQFQTALGPLLNLVGEAGAGLEISGSDDLMKIANQVGRILVDSPDTIRELIYQYAPNIDADCEWIESEAYDSELITAFQQIMGLAYPFGSLARQFKSLASGSKESATAPISKNSPSPNGAKPPESTTISPA